MRIPVVLRAAIETNNNDFIAIYRDNYLKTHTLGEWYKLYDNTIASLSNSSKAFPSFDDESSMSEAIKPHHNED